MRRFVFSLQKVLDYRQRLEEQAIRAFAEAQAQLMHEQAVLHKLLVEREECLRVLDTLPLLQEQEAHAREVYLHLRREREALSRLRQRAYEQFQTELQRALQTEMDEVVALAYQRVVPENPSADTGNPDAH
jgi:flagellar biosynthesis chaperone FliJ